MPLIKFSYTWTKKGEKISLKFLYHTWNEISKTTHPSKVQNPYNTNVNNFLINFPKSHNKFNSTFSKAPQPARRGRKYGNFNYRTSPTRVLFLTSSVKRIRFLSHEKYSKGCKKEKTLIIVWKMILLEFILRRQTTPFSHHGWWHGSRYIFSRYFLFVMPHTNWTL